jgi:type II secretory pathway pseudopilin PulG
MTLIEGLVAILIVSAVTVLITPPMFLSVATRIQNQRAEQATQLATGQVDQVRVLMEQGITAGDPEDGGNVEQLPALAESGNLRDVPAPSSVFDSLQSTNYSCSEYDKANAPQVPADSALKVDVNGDCEFDFYLQSFRVNEQESDSDPESGTEGVPIVFGMGVRVYYRNAEIGGEGVEVEPASLQLTSGQGQQTRFPLAVIYTSLAQGDLDSSLCKYRSYLGGECNP